MNVHAVVSNNPVMATPLFVDVILWMLAATYAVTFIIIGSWVIGEIRTRRPGAIRRVARVLTGLIILGLLLALTATVVPT